MYSAEEQAGLWIFEHWMVQRLIKALYHSRESNTLAPTKECLQKGEWRFLPLINQQVSSPGNFNDISTDSAHIAWMNELKEANDNKEVFTQCIAFDSSFHSPLHGGGAWRANEEYTWTWWLARTDHGEWKLMTLGY